MPSSSKSTAPHPAIAQQRAGARRALIRNVAIMVCVGLVVVLASERRFGDNPRRPTAEAFTGRMDDLYRQVRAGSLELPAASTEVAPDIRGVKTENGRWALAGSLDDTCYALWWTDSGLRHVRIVPDLLACQPQIGSSDDPATVDRSALAADEDEDSANWDPILPPVTIVRIWWIPLLVVAGWVALSASIRIVVILVTRGRNLARWTRAA